MEQIRLTSWYGKYPIIYDGFYKSKWWLSGISEPSTVWVSYPWPSYSHTPYRSSKSQTNMGNSKLPTDVMQPPNSGHIDVTRISPKPHNMIQCIQGKSFNNEKSHLKQHLHTFALRYCWWFRNPGRKPVEVGGLYVVYPTIYKGFNTSRCKFLPSNQQYVWSLHLRVPHWTTHQPAWTWVYRGTKASCAFTWAIHSWKSSWSSPTFPSPGVSRLVNLPTPAEIVGHMIKPCRITQYSTILSCCCKPPGSMQDKLKCRTLPTTFKKTAHHCCFEHW